jgi:hypothetical protein
MGIVILKWFLAVVGVVLIAMLARLAIARARALSQRIDEYHAEQEAKKNQPGAINPYADYERLIGGGKEPEDEDKNG